MSEVGLPSPAPSEQNSQIQAPHWMQQFVENQSKEIEFRLKQTQIDELKERQAYEYSRASLDAQVDHLEKERVHNLARFKFACWSAGVIVAIVLTFLAVIILSGNGQIAIELVKLVVYGGAGAAGGYGIGKSRRASANSESPSQS